MCYKYLVIPSVSPEMSGLLECVRVKAQYAQLDSSRNIGEFAGNSSPDGKYRCMMSIVFQMGTNIGCGRYQAVVRQTTEPTDLRPTMCCCTCSCSYSDTSRRRCWSSDHHHYKLTIILLYYCAL